MRSASQWVKAEAQQSMPNLKTASAGLRISKLVAQGLQGYMRQMEQLLCHLVATLLTSCRTCCGWCLSKHCSMKAESHAKTVNMPGAEAWRGW